MVADFGIALAVSAAGGTRLTETGLSLGTPHYMSPEQATGERELDAKSDVYSLACVTYELFGGEPPHTGPTAQAVVAKLLTEKPQRITALRDTVPAHVEAAVHRALAKLPADRFTTAMAFSETMVRPSAGFALPIEAVAPARAADATAELRFGAKRAVLERAIPWGAAGVAVILAALGWMRSTSPPPAPVTRFILTLPADQQLETRAAAFALSPTGTRLVYQARRGESEQLYLRDLRAFEATPIPGTEGATSPFFSPDGESVAFLSEAAERLETVSLAGGAPLVITDAPGGWAGGSWGPDGSIVFSSGFGLWEIPATGGTPERLTSPDTTAGEWAHVLPYIMRENGTVLFTVASAEGFRVAALIPESGEWHTIIPGHGPVRYLETGHLIFARSDALMAVPFDPDRAEVRASPIPMIGGIQARGLQIFPTPSATISESGSLVYLSGGTAPWESELLWVDRTGRTTPLPAGPNAYEYPRLSPDGRQVALAIHSGDHAVWTHDVNRGTVTRLTDGGGRRPVWTPDGSHVTYGSLGAFSELTQKPADGSAAEQSVVRGEPSLSPSSWAPDGQTLAYWTTGGTSGADIWVRHADEAPRSFLATPFNERTPMFSPDGRWLAYVSDQSGRDEVYVQPYPGPGGRWQISTQGGTEPMWSRNGRELFYRNGDSMMAVAVETEPSFTAGTPQVLFAGQYDMNPGAAQSYDVAPDGRFLMLRSNRESAQLHVVVNWIEELRALGR
jgi:serine/threonine-protein kinase